MDYVSMEVSENNRKKLSWKRKLTRFHSTNYVRLRKEWFAIPDLIPGGRIKVELNKGKSINVSLELIFYLLGGKTINEKMTGYAMYKILLESDNMRFIVMKLAIQKIEVL